MKSAQYNQLMLHFFRIIDKINGQSIAQYNQLMLLLQPEVFATRDEQVRMQNQQRIKPKKNVI